MKSQAKSAPKKRMGSPKSGSPLKIGIIGLGKMGEALVRGFARSQEAFSIQATTRSPESAREAHKRIKVDCHTDNAKVARECEVIVLCVKPHQVKALLEPIAAELSSRHTLISICASVTTAQLSEWGGADAP